MSAPAASPGTWCVRGAPQQLWPTRIYQRTTPPGPDTGTLVQQILTREPADPSVSLGVENARKSAPDVLSWDLPAVAALNGWIRDAALAVTDAGPGTPLTLSGWAVHYRHGGFHEVHAHHDSAVSGVYYLHTDARTSGALELFDPRPARLATTPPDDNVLQQVQPHPGLLIAFPSWLRHAVAPHTAESPRLCIAFNVTVERP
ncbi:putative 2OG-Fe(II) oxygenase [Streptomyces sp. NPDC005538]|uniref:putative 2OG-Fe(II) oxygenase n=1 Tax=Streptomyces sp. NPDC005538 TaxID=3157043 RepID=UPI0033A9FBE5